MKAIIAECVTGKTPKPERERILADFKAGKIKALTSQGVLTTGFDAPLIDLIVLLRATKSPGLYVQILGRGLRISPETDKKDCLVLDYGGNIARHGPIDQITVGRIQAGEGTGKAPIKECPECFELILAGLRVCPACQYEFPTQEIHDSQATGGALLSNQIEPEWLDVDEVFYNIHEKMGKPPSLQVTYRCGFETIREWVCFQHGGYAQQKAIQWWITRYGIESIPQKTKDAYKRINEINDIREPCRILIRPEGKWHRILSYDLTTKPGSPSELNADPRLRPKQKNVMPAGSDVFDTEFDF